MSYILFNKTKNITKIVNKTFYGLDYRDCEKLILSGTTNKGVTFSWTKYKGDDSCKVFCESCNDSCQIDPKYLENMDEFVCQICKLIDM